MDVQTRKLRYFIAVAEELHFSRAAARLFIAQQALSKQIRELEESTGVELLTRTTRRVTLTAAGEAFLAAARKALSALDNGLEEAQRAARGETGVLHIGFGVGAALELTSPIIDEFKACCPSIDLDLREYGLTDPSVGLLDGWSDVALVRLPISDEASAGVEFERLFVEPRVVGLCSQHPLAGRSSVSVYDLLDIPVTIGRAPDATWRRFWTLDDYRAGKPAVIRQTSSHTEEVELVSTGAACTITVAAAARYTPHVGVTYIPVHDIPGSALALGWRTERRTALVEKFLEVATAVRDRETDILRAIEHPLLADALRDLPAQSAPTPR